MKSAVKKEKGKVDLFGERYRARAHQLSPRLRAVVSYINDNREVVLEHTAMEIATATQTSDATVVRAIQALGFAGLRELKQTMERWFGTSVTSAEKMRSTVTALSSDVNSSIDFVLEGHQRVCEVVGDGKPFIGALIELDPDMVRSWLSQQGLDADMRLEVWTAGKYRTGTQPLLVTV